MQNPENRPKPKLYYAETVNPRKVCAAAKYLRSDIDFERVDLASGEQFTPAHLARNPNAKVPVLEIGEGYLWESSAILVWLAQDAGTDLWPSSPTRQADLVRWITWDATNFMPLAGAYYFEHHVKPRLLLSTPDESKLAANESNFHRAAKVLDVHLAASHYVGGADLSVADFCLAATLPYADEIHLPITRYVNIRRWHDRLMALPAWSDPWPSLAR